MIALAQRRRELVRGAADRRDPRRQPHGRRPPRLKSFTGQCEEMRFRKTPFAGIRPTLARPSSREGIQLDQLIFQGTGSETSTRGAQNRDGLKGPVVHAGRGRHATRAGRDNQGVAVTGALTAPAQ